VAFGFDLVPLIRCKKRCLKAIRNNSEKPGFFKETGLFEWHKTPGLFGIARGKAITIPIPGSL
jgi:hypothetical protein